MDTRPVSGYGVTFFRGYDGSSGYRTLSRTLNSCAYDLQAEIELTKGSSVRNTVYGPKRKGGYLSVVSRNAYAVALVAHRP